MDSEEGARFAATPTDHRPGEAPHGAGGERTSGDAGGEDGHAGDAGQEDGHAGQEDGHAGDAGQEDGHRVGPEPPPGGGGWLRARRWVLEWLVVLVVAAGVAVGVRTFIAQTFFIPSPSMEPTLMVGDRILVDKLSYHLHGVGRGDIVVFATPPKEVSDPAIKDLVKRVIGLPGDVVSSAHGQVYIDGRPLREPWLPPGTVTTGIRTQKVPPNEYFVMGDNRSDSQDSRFFGPIPRSLIVGRVVMRIWPLSRLHIF